MPHLQRERDDLLRQAEKIAGQSDHVGHAVTAPKRRRAALADNVILSSKFVVESVRDRYAGEASTPFWCEFPRVDAEALEKRGVEILTDPTERPPRKKITFVKIAEPASVPLKKIDFPQKRCAKGKTSVELASIPSNSSTNENPQYLLGVKDLDWLEVYNKICADKKWPKLSSHDMETILSALDVKKNELTLAHLKSEIAATNKTAEGTANRHRKDYFLLQKYIAYASSTFDQVDHLNLGRSLGLTAQTTFDIWEYWKLKLQDTFYQPLVFPPANVFDYRRISLLAAWNMTTVNYAQRLRHDAERVRLMYDLLQKRNYVDKKVLNTEEEITHELTELCIEHSTEVKHIPPDLLMHVLHYVKELSAHHPPPDPTVKSETEPPVVIHEPLRQWLEPWLAPVEEIIPTSAKAITITTTIPPPHPPLALRPAHRSTTSPPPLVAAKPVVLFPPLDIKPAPNLPVILKEKVRGAGKRKTMTRGRPFLNRGRRRSAVAPLEMPATFEHADNSCCENGPLDDEELRPSAATCASNEDSLLDGSLLMKEETMSMSDDEPLYMINSSGAGNPDESNDSGVVLQEIYYAPAAKQAEFRTRLRSWKKAG